MRLEPFAVGERARRSAPSVRAPGARDAQHAACASGSRRRRAARRSARCAPSAARGSVRRSSRRAPREAWCPMKIAPAWRICGSSASGSATASSRCSGAMRLAIAHASSRSRTRISAPRARERRRDDRRARHRRRCRRRALAATASSRPASGVSRIACAISSCSACEKRSIATQSGLRARVGDDQDLRRAGDHVDAHGAEHAALGRRDVRVAGAADLVDRGNRRGAVGERGDRLRAADRERARRRRRGARPRAPADCARRRAWAPP